MKDSKERLLSIIFLRLNSDESRFEFRQGQVGPSVPLNNKYLTLSDEYLLCPSNDVGFLESQIGTLLDTVRDDSTSIQADYIALPDITSFIRKINRLNDGWRVFLSEKSRLDIFKVKISVDFYKKLEEG